MIRSSILFLIVALLLTTWAQAQEYDVWSYKKTTDTLTGEPKTHAMGLSINYETNAYVFIQFTCVNKRVRLALIVEEPIYIAGKEQEFKIIYRVDKKEPKEAILN